MAAVVSEKAQNKGSLYFAARAGTNAWSTPVSVIGAPTLGKAAAQPWIDEITGTLY